MVRYLDLASFTHRDDPEYMAALGVGDCVPIEPEHRLSMLRNLREGAGVHVVTHPRGAAFWLPVSVEVHVDVWPDGYEFKPRLPEMGMEWALRVQGVTDTAAATLVSKTYAGGKAPTKQARIFDRWLAAEALVQEANDFAIPAQSIIVEAHHIEAVLTMEEQLALLDRLSYAAMDYEWNIDETVGPLFQPEGFSVAVNDRTWYFPLMCSDFRLPDEYGDVLRRKVMDTVMRIPTVWHNAKADLGAQWLDRPLDAWGAPVHDTLLMAFLAGDTVLGLKDQVRRRMGRDPLDFPGAMRNYPLETCRRYGGADARNTYDLFPLLWKVLEARQQLDVYDKMERPLIPLVVDMERAGFPADMEYAQQLSESLGAEAERIRQKFLAEERLDISKDKDIRELVKRRTGYDPGSCQEAVLSRVQAAWMDDVLRFRKVRHRKRAFVDKHIAKWERLGKPAVFSLYTDLNQAGAADQNTGQSFRSAPRTGRFSSSSPDRVPLFGAGAPGGNLQNQPNEGADGGYMEGVAGIRQLYVAPPGHSVWSYDYAQLEMRIAAAMSRDPNLIAAVTSADGPHVDFQNRILAISGKSLPKVAAKQGNFNAQYGGYIDMLRIILQKQRIYLDDESLTIIVDSHKQAYPGYYEYCDAIVEYAKANGGYSTTAFGRRRYAEDLFSADQRTALHAARALINSPTQGTAADILKFGMNFIVPVLKKYPGSFLRLQVHDELVGTAPTEGIEEFCHDIEAALAPIQLPGMRLDVAGGYGKSWYDAH